MTSPTPELTAIVAFSGLGLTLAALGFSAVARRRLGKALAESARRLDALAERLAVLEGRSADRLPPPVVIPPRTPVPIRRVDRPAPASFAGPTLIAVPNMAASSSEPLAADLAESGLGRRHAALWEMADAGIPAEAIARETGQPIGQVELILGLNRRRAAANGRPRPK